MRCSTRIYTWTTSFPNYVNDLFKASNSLMEVVFADMIQIYFCLIKTLIYILIVWMWNLKMSQCGLGLTNCLWILIKLNGCYFILSQKGSYFRRLCLTFLLKIYLSKEGGLTDENLSYKKHIDTVSSKISKSTGIH